MLIRITPEERKFLKMYCLEKDTSIQSLLRDYIKSLMESPPK